MEVVFQVQKVDRPTLRLDEDQESQVTQFSWFLSHDFPDLSHSITLNLVN
jgi:hypothetical protein